MIINQEELKKCILRKMDIHPNLLEEVLDNLALSVQEELAKGNIVKLNGICKLYPYVVEPYLSTAFQKVVVTDRKRHVKFHPLPTLIESINK